MSNVLRGVRAYDGQSYKSIERLARCARLLIAPDVGEHETLSHGPRLFESLRHQVVLVRGRKIAVDYAVEPLPSGVEGETSYDPERHTIKIALSERTYEGLALDEGRAWFTLGHEIGHCMLHGAELVDLGLAPPNPRAFQRKTHEKFQDTEWQSDAFSAALLMPARGLAHLERNGVMLDPFVIRETYNVSHEAAENRLNNYRLRRPDLI